MRVGREAAAVRGPRLDPLDVARTSDTGARRTSRGWQLPEIHLRSQAPQRAVEAAQGAVVLARGIIVRCSGSLPPVTAAKPLFLALRRLILAAHCQVPLLPLLPPLLPQAMPVELLLMPPKPFLSLLLFCHPRLPLDPDPFWTPSGAGSGLSRRCRKERAQATDRTNWAKLRRVSTPASATHSRAAARDGVSARGACAAGRRTASQTPDVRAAFAGFWGAGPDRPAAPAGPGMPAAASPENATAAGDRARLAAPWAPGPVASTRRRPGAASGGGAREHGDVAAPQAVLATDCGLRSPAAAAACAAGPDVIAPPPAASVPGSRAVLAGCCALGWPSRGGA